MVAMSGNIFIGVHASKTEEQARKAKSIVEKAKIAGVYETFDRLWSAEVYRARSFQVACLTMDDILIVAMATDGHSELGGM